MPNSAKLGFLDYFHLYIVFFERGKHMQKQKKTRLKGKKFLRNVSAAILSIVLVIALAVGLIPTTAVEAAVVSDGDTSTKYSESLGDNASTEYSGRIWTDKSVYSGDAAFQLFGGGTATVENDSDFLVAYSALATGMEVKGNVVSPIDVVFIIDMSSSMYNNSMNQNGTRLNNATIALNNAVKQLLSLNDYVRVGVVGYNRTGFTLLPLDHYEQHRGREFFTCSGNTITINAVGDQTYDNVRVSTQSGTNIQKGVHYGMDMLTSEDSTSVVINGANVKRTPSVILLTDGEPSCASNFQTWC